MIGTEAQLLHNVGRRIMRKSGLYERPGFTSGGYDWFVQVGQTKQPFHFDCAIHIEKPLAVMQRVHLREQASVFDAVFKFREMQREILDPDDCAAMVFADHNDLQVDEVNAAYKLLQGTGRVINLADEDEAEQSFRALAV